MMKTRWTLGGSGVSGHKAGDVAAYDPFTGNVANVVTAQAMTNESLAYGIDAITGAQRRGDQGQDLRLLSGMVIEGGVRQGNLEAICAQVEALIGHEIEKVIGQNEGSADTIRRLRRHLRSLKGGELLG